MGKKNRFNQGNNKSYNKSNNQVKDNKVIKDKFEVDMDDLGEDGELLVDEMLENETKQLLLNNKSKKKKSKGVNKKPEEDDNSDIIAEDEINGGVSINNRSENIIFHKNKLNGNSNKESINSNNKIHKKVIDPASMEVEEAEDKEDDEEGGVKKVYENDKVTLAKLKEKIESNFNNKFNNVPNDLFLERLTAVADNCVDKKLNVSDDIKRELIFYNISFDGAVKAINKLKALNQKLNRPDDFMAEMLKSDEQMMKIKKDIMSHEDRIKKFKLREEKMLNKKFNKKTKGNVETKNLAYKKTSKEAIDHWKRSKSYSKIYYLNFN